MTHQSPGTLQKRKNKMRKVMREYKQGRLNNGRSHTPVKKRKQAVAIGLSETTYPLILV